MERRDRSKIGNERERRGERGDDGVHARSARGFSLRVMFRYTELRVERDRTASYDTWNKVAPVKSRSWDVSLVLAPFAFDIRAVRFHAPRPSCPTGPTTVYYQYNPSSFPFLSFLFASRVFPTVVSKERDERMAGPFGNGLVSSPGSRSIRNQDISIISHYEVPASLEFRQRSKRPSARNDRRRSDRLPRILLPRARFSWSNGIIDSVLLPVLLSTYVQLGGSRQFDNSRL